MTSPRQFCHNWSMRKKTVLQLVVVVVVVSVAAIFFLFKKERRAGPQDSIYTFVKLPPGTAAQVKLKDSKLMGQDQVVVLFSDILDEHYKSLVGKQQELLFLAGFEQILKSRISTFKKASFKLSKPLRPLAQVCSQYGVACSRLEDIDFDLGQKEFLVVDNEAIPLLQIKQNTTPLLGAKTEVLNYLLQRIDEQLRMKLLYHVAKKEQKSIQQVVETHIAPSEKIVALAEAEVDRLYQPLSRAARKPFYAALKEAKTNQAIDEYLQRNILQLPISVNIDRPFNDFKTRWDWTPFFGKKPGTSIDVVLFVDMFSDASRTAVRQFLQQMDTQAIATFGIRPYFSGTDPIQWVAAEIQLCVWKHQTNLYWSFLEKSLKAKRDSVESDMYTALKDAGGDLERVKSCAIRRETKPVVEYHLQSAQYLRIINTPVYFIGNEVFVGPLSAGDFAKTLSRQ